MRRNFFPRVSAGENSVFLFDGTIREDLRMDFGSMGRCVDGLRVSSSMPDDASDTDLALLAWDCRRPVDSMAAGNRASAWRAKAAELRAYADSLHSRDRVVTQAADASTELRPVALVAAAAQDAQAARHADSTTATPPAGAHPAQDWSFAVVTRAGKRAAHAATPTTSAAAGVAASAGPRAHGSGEILHHSPTPSEALAADARRSETAS